jgi:hypothetical protein
MEASQQRLKLELVNLKAAAQPIKVPNYILPKRRLATILAQTESDLDMD